MVLHQSGLPPGPRSSPDPPSAVSFCSASASPRSSSFADAYDASATGHSRASESHPARLSSPGRAWIYRSRHRRMPTRITTIPSRRTPRGTPQTTVVMVAEAPAARLRRPTHMRRDIHFRRNRRLVRARPRQSRRPRHSYSAHAHQSPVRYSERASGLPHPPHRSLLTRSHRHLTPSISVASSTTLWVPRGPHQTRVVALAVVVLHARLQVLPRRVPSWLRLRSITSCLMSMQMRCPLSRSRTRIPDLR
jgi:hypothetical protein